MKILSCQWLASEYGGLSVSHRYFGRLAKRIREKKTIYGLVKPEKEYTIALYILEVDLGMIQSHEMPGIWIIK